MAAPSAGSGFGPAFSPVSLEIPTSDDDVRPVPKAGRQKQPWWYTALKIVVIVLVATVVGFGVWLLVDKVLAGSSEGAIPVGNEVVVVQLDDPGRVVV